MMTEFTFVDELPKGRTTSRETLEKFREALNSNSDRWAIYPLEVTEDSARSLCYRVNHGKSKPFPSEFYEAATVQGVLYVKRRDK